MITDGVLANAANFNSAFESKNKPVRQVSSSGAVTNDDYLIEANCTGGAITLTLPACATNTGKVFRFRKTDATVNLLTLDSNGSELIGGQSTLQMISINQVVDIVSNGTSYSVLSNGTNFVNGTLEPMTNISYATYTATPWDQYIRVNVASGNTTITLPQLTDAIRGKQYKIQRRTGADADRLIIQGSGGDVISYHGAPVASINLMMFGESVTLQSGAAASWVIVDRYIPSHWNTWTPTVTTSTGSMTNFTATGAWKRDGGNIFCTFVINFTGAAGTWADVFLRLPSTFTFDTGRLYLGPNGQKILGTFAAEDNGVQSYHGKITWFTSNRVVLAMDSASGTYVTPAQLNSSAPFGFASGDGIAGSFIAPITNWEG